MARAFVWKSFSELMDAELISYLFIHCFTFFSCHFHPVDMSRYIPSSTSRALYRVFIAPTLRAPTPLRLQNAFLVPHATSLLPKVTTRSLNYQKDVQRHDITDHFVLDNDIEATYVDLIDEEGNFEKKVPFRNALSSYNRVTHYLVQVRAAPVDEDGFLVPGEWPVCKIISKIKLRAQHQLGLETARRTAQGKGLGPDPKELELNWAIAGGDLDYRLVKLQGFLREGRKVTIVLGPKRKGKAATEDECDTTLQRVRDAVAEIKGAREVKEPEGVKGGIMTLVFQDPDTEKDIKNKKKKERKEEVQNTGGTEEDEKKMRAAQEKRERKAAKEQKKKAGLIP
jgi:translation initiation factor IF-3